MAIVSVSGPTHAAILLLRAMHNAGIRIGVASETKIHQVADANVKRFMVAVQYAFARGRAYSTPDACARAVKNALLDVLPTTLMKVLREAGDVTLSEYKPKALSEADYIAWHGLADKPTLAFRFDVSDPLAVKWARKHAAELADDLSETTRDDVKHAIAAGLEGQMTRREVLKAIKDAVGSDERAELIARTETMYAANEGQRQGWKQAAKRGLLTKDQRRVWILTEGACPLCQAMEDATASLNGDYPRGGGDGPPLHPRCRCTEGIV